MMNYSNDSTWHSWAVVDTCIAVAGRIELIPVDRYERWSMVTWYWSIAGHYRRSERHQSIGTHLPNQHRKLKRKIPPNYVNFSRNWRQWRQSRDGLVRVDHAVLLPALHQICLHLRWSDFIRLCCPVFWRFGHRVFLEGLHEIHQQFNLYAHHHHHFFYLDKTKHKCQGHVGTYRHHGTIHDRVVIAVQ